MGSRPLNGQRRLIDWGVRCVPQIDAPAISALLHHMTTLLSPPSRNEGGLRSPNEGVLPLSGFGIDAITSQLKPERSTREYHSDNGKDERSQSDARRNPTRHITPVGPVSYEKWRVDHP